MIQADEQNLISILRTLRRSRIGALLFRLVPLKYANSADSMEGARIHGGRYNPPLELAAKLCDLPDGFGCLYTATNPITALFECGHILRGLGPNEFQSVSVEPTLLVSFKIEADTVLDLRNDQIQAALDLSTEELMKIDDRNDLNEAGALTPLQQLGVAAYKSGNFSAMIAPSRFCDVVDSYCVNLLQDGVRVRIQDVDGLLNKIEFR